MFFNVSRVRIAKGSRVEVTKGDQKRHVLNSLEF